MNTHNMTHWTAMLRFYICALTDYALHEIVSRLPMRFSPLILMGQKPWVVYQ